MYVDYQGLNTEEILKVMDDATEFALKENRQMLCLSNMAEVFAVPAVVDRAKESAKKTAHLTIKRAAVGIVGAKKVLFNAFNRFTGGKAKAFEKVKEAKERLVND